MAETVKEKLKRLQRHIDVLENTGQHQACYLLTGRVDLNRLGRHFNMMLKRRHPEVVETRHHFFWFKTNDGVVLSYTGNMFLLGAVDEFMTKAVDIGITGAAEELYYGRSKDVFMAEVLTRLTQFKTNSHGRSFGGARLG
ncbi:MULTISPECIES: hypothetical protein [unclassified Pseudomonas]|uniref:hypothetical protein n=1 Tax=unclassified Pseudomonas TaxID=196821 RepID=UPI0039B782CC